MSDPLPDAPTQGRTLRPSGVVSSIRAGQVPLAGRSREREFLEEESGRAFAEGPRAVFLTGAAGIGKSRLLRGAITAAQTDDPTVSVLFGRCVDERRMPPFLPWLDAFSTTTPTSANGQVSLSLLPILAGAGDPGRNEVTILSPAQGKLRLFEHVVRAIAVLAAVRPVLLAFDDLQWSDAASNELLRYVLIHAPPVPLLVLGASRSEEATANLELTRTVAELERHRLLRCLPIGPLTVTEAESLLVGLISTEHSNPALVAAIHEHCEGNPFLVEEVVRTLADEGRLTGSASIRVATQPLPLPRGVTAVVERRMERASERCRSVLDIAALIGPRISGDLVAAVADIGFDAVAEALDGAAQAALARPLAPHEITAGAANLGWSPDFAFLHDRVRVVIAARINPVRRRVLHARIGAALASAPTAADDPTRLAALTHHLRLGGQAAAAAV